MDNESYKNLGEVPPVFVENNMFLNLGQKGYFHMSFPDSQRERDVVFYGTIIEAAKDHTVIHDPNNNKWYLLPYLYLNYIEFPQKPITHPLTSLK